MPQVTLTLTDTPNGQIDIQTDFKPSIGAPCTAAQAAALDIIARTRKAYGLTTTQPTQGGTAHAVAP